MVLFSIFSFSCSKINQNPSPEQATQILFALDVTTCLGDPKSWTFSGLCVCVQWTQQRILGFGLFVQVVFSHKQRVLPTDQLAKARWHRTVSPPDCQAINNKGHRKTRTPPQAVFQVQQSHRQGHSKRRIIKAVCLDLRS